MSSSVIPPDAKKRKTGDGQENTAPQYEYTSLLKVKEQNGLYHLFGVVVEASAPRATKGSDHVTAFKLTDPSVSGQPAVRVCARSLVAQTARKLTAARFVLWCACLSTRNKSQIAQVSVNMFGADVADLPALAVGDVVRLHRVKRAGMRG